jgi:hypothetical protein
MAGPGTNAFTPLRTQLREVRIARDVGTVSALARDHVDVVGLQSVAAVGDRVRIGDAAFGEILSIGADSCRVMTEGATAGLRLGTSVVNLGEPRIAPCDGWLGRIVDPYGAAMDEAPLPMGDRPRPIWSAPPPPATRRGLGGRLPTGLAVCDTLLPIVRGQRVGLFAGSGVGKSRLLGTLANAMEADVIVVGLVGERGREVRDFVKETLSPEALSRTVVVAATSDRAALTRVRAAATMLTVAEHFRDRAARPAACRFHHPLRRGAGGACRRGRRTLRALRLSRVDGADGDVAGRTRGPRRCRTGRHHRGLHRAGGGLRHGGTRGRHHARRARRTHRPVARHRRAWSVSGDRCSGLRLARASRGGQPGRVVADHPGAAASWPLRAGRN